MSEIMNQGEELNEEQVTDLFEELSQRSEHVKVYCTSPNQYHAMVFAETVHKRGQDGSWQEIDNQLIEKGSDKERYLTNDECSPLNLKLYNANAAEMTVLADDKGHTISWCMKKAQPVAPEIISNVVENQDKPADLAEALDRVHERISAKLTGEALYRDIHPGVNLYCAIDTMGFKENLVYQTMESVGETAFHMSADGLVPVVDPDDQIRIIDAEGEEIFILPAPTVQDAAGEDGKVYLSIKDAEDGYDLSYEIDPDWLSTAKFPVTLDPTVRTANLTTAIKDCYVTTKARTTVYNNSELFVTKGNNQKGTCHSYLKVLDSSLPKLSSSYYVTYADLVIFLTQSGGTNGIYLREVTGAWSDTTLTWNTQPTAASKYINAIRFTRNSPTKYYHHDITNLAREWYRGNNNGLRMEADSGYLQVFRAMNASSVRPYLVIKYQSMAGSQQGMTYENQSVGRAGSGQVSLYNGNLIFTHQDTAMNGNLMPISISHVYNSCYYKKNAFGVGFGWMLSAEQYLHREALPSSDGSTTTTYYVLTDSAGARHFFGQSNGEWKDQSGLAMKLTISGSEATITTKMDTKMVFDLPTVNFSDNDENEDISAYANVKPLKRITDACGNEATFTTDADRRLLTVTDGVGRQTVITQSEGMIVSIEEPGAPQVDYAYTNGYLTSITYHDEDTPQSAYYGYNDDGLLMTVTNIDGLTVTYSYTDNTPHRVSRVEYSKNGTKFGGRKYEYKDNLTVVTDLIVEEGELVEGKKLYYHFNDSANVISVNDDLGYALFARYSSSSPLNHPDSLSRMQRAVVNLLKNHGLTSTSSWTTDHLDGATGSFSASTAHCAIGKSSIQLNKTSADGELALSQSAVVSKGKTYTLSAYGLTTGAAKAAVRIIWQDANEVAHVESSEAEEMTAWDRPRVSFTLPEDAASDTITVRLVLTGGIGTLCWCCAQLEPNGIANRYNHLINGDFTFNTDAKPSGWSGKSNNTANDKVYSAHTGNQPEGLSGNVLRLYGNDHITERGFYQNIALSGNAGDVYTIGGWSLGYARPWKGSGSSSYGLRMTFKVAGSSSDYTDDVTLKFSDEWTDWQFACIPVVAKHNYTSMRLFIDYGKNINYAEFAGLFVHKEEFGRSYAYDANGNVLSTKDLAAQQSHATYDAYNNLLTYRQTGRSADDKYTLDWGTEVADKKKHLLLKTTSPLGIIQENTYDDKGNVETSKTRNSASTLVIQGSTAYTENKNYVASQTDARGYTSASNYDLTKGTLSSVTSPNGQVTSYSYDQLKRMTQAQSVADGKTYLSQNTYNQDKLVKTAHNTTDNAVCDVEYNFSYDDLGRQTEVKVGTQLLSATEYNDDGTVKEVVYGNDTATAPQKISYTYDDFKRLKGVKLGTDVEDRYAYEYGANGHVQRLTDHHLNREYLSEYDLAERPMRMIQRWNGEHVYTGQVAYNSYNNLATFKEKVGPEKTAYQTAFTYDKENKPTKMTFGSESNKIEYLYDAIGRMQKRTLTVNGHAYETNYSYLAGANGGNTTALISGISQGTSADGLTYEYDNMGNITKVTRGTGENAKETSYVYDSMGQLIRVNDQTDTTSGNDGTTWVYEYDCGGNILSKTRYPYTTETPVVDGVTINYTYGNSNWKDQLTEYNGATIQYDNIGNPTDDGTWTYTWENGRQLKEMSKGTVGAEGYMKIEYRYNAEGLRIQKIATETTASGTTTTTTNYILHGKNIVHLTQGDDELHFFYDASNKPAIVDFNGTKYGYVQNLQGDICQIIDSNGTAVVEYTYDAWGKVMDVTGTMAGSLGTIQPFRYRGYVYDIETGLNYLRSRYYNPENERFLNTDGRVIGNLFAYCHNTPIINIDEFGNEDIDIRKFYNSLKEGDYYIIQLKVQMNIRDVDDQIVGSIKKGTKLITRYDIHGKDRVFWTYHGCYYDKATGLLKESSANYVIADYKWITVVEKLLKDDEYMYFYGDSNCYDLSATTQYVMNLQADLGMEKSEIDGKCGQITVEYIKQFQRDNGLKDDGIAGKRTKQKLYDSRTEEIW